MTRLAKLTLVVLAAVATLGAQNIQNSNIRGLKNRVFSVIDYGATANGTTDDTAAIQRAIDAAEVNGGIVDIPRGTYKISRLTINKGITLRGAGRFYTTLRTTETSGSIILFHNTDPNCCVGGGASSFTLFGSNPYHDPTGTETGIVVSNIVPLTSVTVASNVATVVTSMSTLYAAGGSVAIYGATGDTDLNGVYTIATRVNATTFTIPTSGVSDGVYNEATLAAFGSGRWNQMIFDDIETSFLANGISTDGDWESMYSRLFIRSSKPGTGVHLHVGHGARFFNKISTYNKSGREGAASIKLTEGGMGDVFSSISLLGAHDGVLMQPAVGAGYPNNNGAAWGEFTDLLSDSMTGCGINIVPDSGASVGLWVFNNTWTSNTHDGICTSGSGTISNIQFNGGRVRGASGNGFTLEAGTNIQVRNVNIETNLGHGIYANGIVVLDIQSNSIGHPYGDTQLYGIYLTGTTDAVNITGNSIRGNATGTIFDDTTAGDKWIGNNQNIDQGVKTLASAASITIDATPRVVLTGTTTVKTMLAAPNWTNRKVYIQATDAAPAQPTLTIGGAAGSTFDRPITLKQNEIAECVYSGTDFTWHCVGPNNPLVMVSLGAQNDAIASDNLYASAPVGTYEATAYLHTTTASAGSCTSNVTIGYTFNGGAKSVNVIASHNHQVDEAASTSTPATFAIDNATHITRAVDLTVGGGDCSNVVYSLRIVLKKVI